MHFLPAARLLLAATLAANGIAMLAVPEFWYHTLPGVSGTGPLNVHFVRDIGCAYLVSAFGLAWMARDHHAWPAAMMGALFLSGHALVHAGELIVDFHLDHLLRDFAGVFLVPAAALWLAWPSRQHTHNKEVFHAQDHRSAAARRF